MLAIAGMRQLRELWVEGDDSVPFEDGCLLQHCPAQRSVTQTH
jgi:hypothetical protein